MAKQVKQGWGVTHSEDHLYMTDGSNKIFVFNRNNAQEVIKEIRVQDEKGNPVFKVNELEYYRDPMT